MIIVLMGFLGAGKTSIGTLLASELGYTPIELDEYTLKKTGFKSVTDAYKQNVLEWKQKELESSKELSQKDNIVVISNGAMIENDLNMDYFRKNAKKLKVIYIQTNPEVLTSRLMNLYDEFKKESPKIVLKTMSKHFERRDSLYKDCADMVINTEDSTPKEACTEILQKIKN